MGRLHRIAFGVGGLVSLIAMSAAAAQGAGQADPASGPPTVLTAESAPTDDAAAPSPAPTLAADPSVAMSPSAASAAREPSQPTSASVEPAAFDSSQATSPSVESAAREPSQATSPSVESAAR